MIPLGFVLGILGQTRLDLLLATSAATILELSGYLNVHLSCTHLWDKLWSLFVSVCPHLLQRFIDLSGSLWTHLFSQHLCDRPVSMILSVYVLLSGYLSASY